MAYYSQGIMNARPGPTTASGVANPQIVIENGVMDDIYINRAVTLDGEPTNLACPEVRLAGENEIVLGAIIGYSYGKLQIAVEGLDIAFLIDTYSGVRDHTPIIGATYAAFGTSPHPYEDGNPGFVKSVPAISASYSAANLLEVLNGRGFTVDSGVVPTNRGGSGTTDPGNIVHVSMALGG